MSKKLTFDTPADLFRWHLAHAETSEEEDRAEVGDTPCPWCGCKIYKLYHDGACPVRALLAHGAEYGERYQANRADQKLAPLLEPIPDDAPPPPGWERYTITDEQGCPHESPHVRRAGPTTFTVQDAWAIYQGSVPPDVYELVCAAREVLQGKPSSSPTHAKRRKRLGRALQQMGDVDYALARRQACVSDCLPFLHAVQGAMRCEFLSIDPNKATATELRKILDDALHTLSSIEFNLIEASAPQSPNDPLESLGAAFDLCTQVLDVTQGLISDYPLKAHLFGLVMLFGIFAWGLTIEWRPYLREIKDDDRRIWFWVKDACGWQVGYLVDSRTFGPSVWTGPGLFPTPLRDLQHMGPRVYLPDLRDRVYETRQRVEPGWWWVFVDDAWVVGHVLWYDAHGGPAGTLLSTPGRNGRVWDAKAWGPRLEPPDPKRDAARVVTLLEALDQAMRGAQTVRNVAEGEIKYYIFPWEEKHPDYPQWRDLLASDPLEPGP